MVQWEEWTPQRFFYLFVALAYFMMFVQVGLLHWRGAFRRAPMWVPVILAPVLGLIGLAYSFVHGPIADTAFMVFYSTGALAGLVGFLFHLSGIRHYIGGFTLRNFMTGPPIMLPAMFMALSAAVLIVFFVWPLGGGR